MATPFQSVPRSNIESKATQPVGEENSILVQVMKEILTWFFSVNGKHRDLLLQASFADSYAIDPTGSHQQKINLYNVSTYQFRRDPALVVHAGSIKGIKTGLGIALEHSLAASQFNCLQKRSIGTYAISITAESSLEQTTHKLAKLLNDIFFQHIPEYYQNVIYGDFNNSQIIFPQEYNQSEILSNDFQRDSNIERVYRYVLSFEVEYESIRFIKGFDKIRVDNSGGSMILEHDLPSVVHMGKLYPIVVRTNLLGVNLYTSNSNIFQLHQLSGPQGEGNGDRYYHGTALRIGPFKLKLIDIHQSHIQESNHTVNF